MGRGRKPLDHLPIILQLEKEDLKPTKPFKFNHTWLEEERIEEMIMQNWKMFDQEQGDFGTYPFVKDFRNARN